MATPAGVYQWDLKTNPENEKPEGVLRRIERCRLDYLMILIDSGANDMPLLDKNVSVVRLDDSKDRNT